jgi:DNA polymerase
MKVPVYDIKNCGPRHRFAANGKLVSNCNPQNLTPEIQAGITPPSGYELIVADASQIEYRMLCWMAGQQDALDRLHKGEDIYATVASAFYGRTIAKETDPTERQVGKVITLGAGYGAGGDTLARILRVNAGIRLDYQERVRARDAYRTTHRHVVWLWHQADSVLRSLAEGKPRDWGPVAVHDGCLWLPNGCPLIFDTLQWQPDGWRVQRRNGLTKVYGAKLTENLIQALARNYISDIMNRILAQGLRIVLSRHDDVVLLVKPDDAADVSRWLTEEMQRPPVWAKDIPLGCECNTRSRLK